MLTDLKDYFKNTSPEKIKSDWEETEKYDRVGITVNDYLEQDKLFKEFEILEGITPEQFDDKDWSRFERFVKNRAEDESKATSVKTERLYTIEDIRETYMAGYKFSVDVDEVGWDNTNLPNQEQYIENLKK